MRMLWGRTPKFHKSCSSPQSRTTAQPLQTRVKSIQTVAKMAKDTPYDRKHFPPEEGSNSATSSDGSPLTTSTEEPLYTEIRIQLPRIAQPLSSTSKPASHSRSRSRAYTLASSFSPFHRRQSSTPSVEKGGEKPASTGGLIKNLASRRKRAGTVDALPAPPAVLASSAELLTSGKEGKKDARESDKKGD